MHWESYLFPNGLSLRLNVSLGLILPLLAFSNGSAVLGLKQTISSSVRLLLPTNGLHSWNLQPKWKLYAGDRCMPECWILCWPLWRRLCLSHSTTICVGYCLVDKICYLNSPILFCHGVLCLPYSECHLIYPHPWSNQFIFWMFTGCCHIWTVHTTAIKSVQRKKSSFCPVSLRCFSLSVYLCYQLVKLCPPEMIEVYSSQG